MHLGVIAIKGYSTFHEASGLASNHQIVLCHYQNTRLVANYPFPKMQSVCSPTPIDWIEVEIICVSATELIVSKA